MKSTIAAGIIFVFLFAAVGFSVPMTQIWYQADELGAGRWQYTYNVSNFSLPVPIEQFTIYFDYGDDVQPLQELNGLQVLSPPMNVADPLPFLAGVVGVEHGCDGVGSKAVHVVPVQPEQGVSEEEVGHLVPAVIEDQGLPVRMIRSPGIRVLVDAGPIEGRQAVVVRGEMPWDPVQDDR